MASNESNGAKGSLGTGKGGEHDIGKKLSNGVNGPALPWQAMKAMERRARWALKGELHTCERLIGGVGAWMDARPGVREEERGSGQSSKQSCTSAQCSTTSAHPRHHAWHAGSRGEAELKA